MLNELTKSLKHIIYTKENKCCFCNNSLTLYENIFCNKCLYGISSWNNNYITCKICGKFIKGQIICNDCGKSRPPFIMAKAVGAYEGIIKETLQRFKYQGLQSLAGPMGRLMALEALKYKEFMQCSLITFVPLSTERLRERGYNQSQLLAHELSRYIRLPVGDLLKKTIDTEPMAKLTKEERLKNLAHVFRAKKQVNLQRVILVDDVYTTGSTVSLCCRELLKGGIKEVYVLTFATGCDIM
ncbi:ComF family protein [Desulfitibacter alkalitolerans]|uniref:ComF family protein n=1 Tax=Desulfitibacter alkalitolerans TaxID=264641 RepID=UPI0006857315|nr:ComF family protein [Desulfitibacter alkalitolerans]